MLKIIFGCILGIGFVALIGYFLDNTDASRSATWPTVHGRLDTIDERAVSMPLLGRYIPLCSPHATYSYSINSKDYHGEKNSGVCVSWVRMFMYTPPPTVERDATKILEEEFKGGDPAQNLHDALEKAEYRALHPEFKPVKVRYNAERPEESVLDPDVLQSGRSQMATAALLMGVGGIGLLAMIIHSNVTAPVADDPTLSLEAALAAQKRRGRPK